MKKGLFMKKYKILKFLILLFIFIFTFQSVYSQAFKDMMIGRLHWPYLPHGHSKVGRARKNGWYYYDNFNAWQLGRRLYYMVVEDFVDTLGQYWGNYSVKDGDLDEKVFPVSDSLGFDIYSYRRYAPCEVVVDGEPLTERFTLQENDVIDPDKIPGTADGFIESWFRTAIGATFHQRVMAWGYAPYYDFHLIEMTIKNTGNADLDDEIEFPDDTLKNFYYAKYHNYKISHNRDGIWGYYGARPEDSMRIAYKYDCNSVRNSGYDDFGAPDLNDGFLEYPWWAGIVVCHVDSSVDNRNDDPTQPRVTAQINHKKGRNLFNPVKIKEGLASETGLPETEGQYPGTHHLLPAEYLLEHLGIKYPQNSKYTKYPCSHHWSIGPYTIPPGDSVQFIYALVRGTITQKTGWTVGKAWLAGEAEELWDGPYKLNPQLEQFDDLTENDMAKDSWVNLSKDSLFANARAAIWAAKHNYQVPRPPPAPSIEVMSQPDRIVVKWGNESEAAPDLAGYRVYRATGDYFYNEVQGEPIGDWELMAEVAKGTNLYEDKSAQRGVAYFYYVSAFDDGSHPEVAAEHRGGVSGTPQSLETSLYDNVTLKPAYLSRAPGEELHDIRVVPNPYNISAEVFQYPGEPRKIMFLNLPPRATISIYNERGDLVRRIEHTDGSGDEAWADETGEHFMTTSSSQVPQSGLYFAHIETPDGRSTDVPFIIIR